MRNVVIPSAREIERQNGRSSLPPGRVMGLQDGGAKYLEMNTYRKMGVGVPERLSDSTNPLPARRLAGFSSRDIRQY